MRWVQSYAEPVQVLELEYRRPGGGGKSSGVPVSPTCMDFQEGGANSFILGCETGAVYSAARYQIDNSHFGVRAHFRHGAKSGIQTQFKGHEAPVTG